MLELAAHDDTECPNTMWNLALACAVFLSIHLLVGGVGVKDWVIEKIGAPAWYILFSLVSLACFVWLCIAFFVALGDHMNVVVWGAPLFLKIIALVLNFVAFLLVVLGVTTPSPTNLLALVRMPERPVYGIVRISRHPVLAGIGLWALIHLICNGNLASWLFFGSLVALCAIGAHNIDRKREAALGNLYASIKKRTSIVPFVAIIEGRTAFAPEELGIARVFLAASMFSVFLALHEMLFTARAL